jgi:hypothetical protein
MKPAKLLCLTFCIVAFGSLSLAEDLPTFRLLSISESEKLILVLQVPGKTKYLLDASSAKITIDGKPAEYKSLKAYSEVQLKMEIRKESRNGIYLDGVATEIRINYGEKAK